jgi:hypothetical protein
VGTLETQYDRSQDLTIVKATGRMTPHDFREWTRAYYAGRIVTQRMVWDLTEADLSAISVEDVLDNVNDTRKLAGDLRSGGKTAIVADDNWIAVCLSRYRETFLEMSDLPIVMRTFSHMDEALEWLGS